MKKIIPIAATALLAGIIIISSCKKKDDNPVGNYTCRCTLTTSTGTTTADLPYSNVAKNTASASCTSTQNTYNAASASSGITASCSLL